jgi:hypothetical protein
MVGCHEARDFQVGQAMLRCQRQSPTAAGGRDRTSRGNYGLPEWLRVTIGLPEENARFLETLTEALKAPSKSADRREPATGAST